MIEFPAPPPGGYATIVVDPPWPVHNGKGYKTKPGVYGNYPIESRYPLMPVPEIKALPVLQLAAERCFVFICTT